MPLPRFYKLPKEKQLELLQAATSELATHGFEAVSLGAIVERVGLSKSAVYYYFIDKADLLDTVLLHNLEAAVEIVGDFDPDTMRCDFWSALLDRKTQIVRHFAGRPESRALWGLALSTPSAQAPESLPATNAKIRARWTAMLELGRECGAVRTDLAMPLLLDLVLAVDSVGQRHAVNDFNESDDFDETTRMISVRAIDLIRRLLSPELESQ